MQETHSKLKNIFLNNFYFAKSFSKSFLCVFFFFNDKKKKNQIKRPK